MIKTFQITILLLICVLIFQAFQILSTIKDVAVSQQYQLQIESEQLDNSNALNCYTLNDKETEREYYQCMYDAK